MPPSIDIWLMAHVANLLGRSRTFDLAVQNAIGTGGVWYAASVFLLWSEGAWATKRRDRERILTILAGSVLAGTLSVLATGAVSWVPPARHPQLAHFYPAYLRTNTNANSFPSESTAVYTAVAAGIYSLHKGLGHLLWVSLGVFVALPRMYVGGHYATDVVAGLLLGVMGYFCAVSWLEPRLVARLDAAIEKGQWSWRLMLADLGAFAWIFQLATEFGVVRRLWSRLFGFLV